MDSFLDMSEGYLATMELERFFQENPDWDDGWPNYGQEEEEEDQVGGAQIDISDHVEVTAAGKFGIVYNHMSCANSCKSDTE